MSLLGSVPYRSLWEDIVQVCYPEELRERKGRPGPTEVEMTEARSLKPAVAFGFPALPSASFRVAPRQLLKEWARWLPSACVEKLSGAERGHGEHPN